MGKSFGQEGTVLLLLLGANEYLRGRQREGGGICEFLKGILHQDFEL
jgi:hypothetical protein